MHLSFSKQPNMNLSAVVGGNLILHQKLKIQWLFLSCRSLALY